MFAAAELTLAMAVPFLAIKGYHTLLGSQAGVVVDQPEPGEPGWSALVDPTQVVGVAETTDGRLTGMAFVVLDDAGGAASVMVAPGELSVGDDNPNEPTADELDPAVVVRSMAEAMRLRLSAVEVVGDEEWVQAFGDSVLTVDNPDPVFAADGSPLFEVGIVDVAGDQAGRFVGRPTEGATLLSLGLRRQEFWSAVVDTGLAGSGPLAAMFPGAGGDAGQGSEPAVFELPAVAAPAGSEGVQVDLVAAEELVRTLVAFPAGLDGTDRLRIRIVGGDGDADLEDMASQVAARGLEVVEISTAATPYTGPSQLIVPIELSVVVDTERPGRTAMDDLNDLAAELDAEQLVTTRSDDQRTVSLVVGSDMDLGALVS